MLGKLLALALATVLLAACTPTSASPLPDPPMRDYTVVEKSYFSVSRGSDRPSKIGVRFTFMLAGTERSTDVWGDLCDDIRVGDYLPPGCR